MSRIRVEAILTTSNPVARYGVALHPRALTEMAIQIRSGNFPMRLDHDECLRLNPQLIDVEVRWLPDKHVWGLWAEYELDEQEWERLKGRGGFSVAFFTDHTEHDPVSDKPRIFIGYDPAHFSPEAVRAAVDRMLVSANVSTGKLYQFSAFVPDAKVVIEFAVMALEGLAVNALWEGLKYFLRPTLPRRDGQPEQSSGMTVFQIHNWVRQGKTRKTAANTAVIRTNDEDVLRRALEAYDRSAAREIPLAMFCPETGEYTPVRDGDGLDYCPPPSED